MRQLFIYIFVFLAGGLVGMDRAQAEQLIVPVEDGPVGNSITNLLQDDDGFMWVGTISGLMRYDMRSYHYFDDIDGLPVSRTRIRCLARDAEGNIWVGTENGAVVYDTTLERFRRIGGRITALPVKTITRAPQGVMMLTTNEGIAFVNPKSLEYRFVTAKHLNNILEVTTDTEGDVWSWGHGQLSHFDFSDDPMDPRIESHTFAYEVRAMAVDHYGRLWFNDRQRLMMVTLPTGDEPLSAPRLISRGIDARAIRIEANEVIVVSSYNGIHQFRITDDGTPVKSGLMWIDAEAPNEVCNSVQCVERDRDGHYWFGTADGVYVGYESPREIFHKLSSTSASESLTHNVISDLYLAADSTVWAATSGGLDRIRQTASGHYHIDHFIPRLSPGRVELGDQRLQTLVCDRQGLMWIGTKRLLLFFNPLTRQFVERKPVTDFLARHGALFSKELHSDSRGNIWMGFIYGGLFAYDPASEQCRIVNFADIDLYDAVPQTILEDADGSIWIGTKSKGLLRFRPESVRTEEERLVIEHYDSYFLEDPNHSKFISINTLCATDDRALYVGTSHGIYRYESALNRFVACPMNAFGKEVWVLDIIADRDNTLWISTTQGLYHYTPGAGQAPFYELAGGSFARLDYNLGSCIGPDGTLFIGGVNGLTYFHPQRTEQPHEAAKVYVSNISVLNREIRPDGVHLEANINHSRRLTLNYDDYQLSLDFSTLKFALDGRERFYYRIDGLSADWVALGDTNRLSFSNLAPGEYLLQVKATDALGLLGEDSTDILIKVLPPWWLTWWAYCIYALLALLIAAITVWIILIRYRATQQVRMVKYKQQLFINLTHGLKTPLTMMQVPLQLIAGEHAPLSDEERRTLLAMISANVKKLSNMIRQLMEFRKIDQRQVSMNLAEIDIVAYVGCICDYFRAHFEAKNLKIECDLPTEQIAMTVDPEKIELVLYNLLQNAYTFTHPGGKVQVSLQRDEQGICIAVRDTGIGIRSEYLDKIFRRFWQVHESDTMPTLGAGIGLAVAREFVEMHNGCIKVESRYGTGSCFTICLPMEGRYKAEQYYIHKSDQADDEQILPVYTKQYAESDLYIERNPDIDESKSDMIYVVAGGSDIARLARMVLPNYNVLNFNNVEQSLQGISDRRPSAVLIDTEVYDREEGLTLCRKIKQSNQTNDIPVLLLTADDSPEVARIFCEAGADAWMEKPFDVELFRARVQQLVERQANLQQKIKLGQILNQQPDIIAESADEKFMSRVMEVIEQNIPNETFSLEVFAREMGVSRSVLNMRIQHIVGKSPMELLRNARMQRAAQLLASNTYDVAQVGYMVGFSDPRYFSTSFKKQFGMSPRAYMQKQ